MSDVMTYSAKQLWSGGRGCFVFAARVEKRRPGTEGSQVPSAVPPDERPLEKAPPTRWSVRHKSE
jgi:hypothetical protein